jgi:putative alpha-1,2-mannosidase
MTYLGGPSEFVERLNFLHDQDITYIGNEPAFLTVFQYHYAGRPALSALRSHFYIPAFFSPTDGGLPGNDDSGAMGSFVAFSMMGLFPNPGQNVYLITPPYFESVSVTNPLTNKTATIRNVNFDPSYKNIYIQSATLDGQNYTKNWIDHSFFTEGKELVLTLGSSESSWGTAVADLPPSLGTYVGFGNSTLKTTSARLRRAVTFDGHRDSVFPNTMQEMGKDFKTGGAYWAEPAGRI